MQPLAAAATALPPAALRADLAVAVTAFARYLPQLLQVLNYAQAWSSTRTSILLRHSDAFISVCLFDAQTGCPILFEHCCHSARCNGIPWASEFFKGWPWQGGGDIRRLVGPFSDIVDGVVKDKFVRNWLDLLSFLLSGVRSKFQPET